MDCAKIPQELLQDIRKLLGLPEYGPSLLKAVQSLIDSNASKQAEIDRLMLEFCPEEMTEDQKAEWAKHQKPLESK